MSATTPDVDSLKARLKATWTAGDFGQIARSHERGAADFVARLRLAPGARVLDVACGTGNLAIPAARAGAIVTGVDIAPNLLDQARTRARTEGLTMEFDEGDVEALPYADAAFDVVLSMFGAMFAPRPPLVAAELVRVCRPGGRIAMTNWTPGGFVGQMFKIVATHVSPPAGVPSPVLWGDEAAVGSRLRDGVAELTLTRRLIAFDYPFGPASVVEAFRTYYGPTLRAFEALDGHGQARLRHDLEALWSGHNQATNGTTHVDAEYLEVLAGRS